MGSDSGYQDGYQRGYSDGRAGNGMDARPSTRGAMTDAIPPTQKYNSTDLSGRIDMGISKKLLGIIQVATCQIAAFFAMVALLAVSSQVNAQSAAYASCSNASTYLAGCAGNFGAYGFSSAIACTTYYKACFAKSPSSLSQQFKATAAVQSSAISSAIGSSLSSGSGPSSTQVSLATTGLAAGGTQQSWNAWSSVSINDASYAPADNTKKRAANVTNLLVGADYRLSPTMVLGVSAGLDRGSGSVTASAIGISTEGMSIAPYFGVQLSKNLALDLMLGFSSGEFRQNGGTAGKSNGQVFGANLSHAHWIGNWQISGKAGYLDAVSDAKNSQTNGVVNEGTAFKNKIGQLSLAGEVGYWMNGVMPYAGIGYTKDTRLITSTADNAWDRDAFVLKVGANFFSLSDKMTGGIAYMEESGRSSARNATLMGNINIRF